MFINVFSFNHGTTEVNARTVLQIQVLPSLRSNGYRSHGVTWNSWPPELVEMGYYAKRLTAHPGPYKLKPGKTQYIKKKFCDDR